MKPLALIALALTAVALLFAGCAAIAYRDPQAYWSRPGWSLPQLASEAERCYETAVALEAPAALGVSEGTPSLLPRTTPPPGLWRRAPRHAGFEHFGQQLRYERCMRALGWDAARTVSPAL
jgi:hypothetical protein